MPIYQMTTDMVMQLRSYLENKRSKKYFHSEFERESKNISFIPKNNFSR